MQNWMSEITFCQQGIQKTMKSRKQWMRSSDQIHSEKFIGSHCTWKKEQDFKMHQYSDSTDLQQSYNI